MPQVWIQPTQNSFIDTFSQVEALKAQRAQNAFNEAKIAELPYEREREEALNTANIGKATAQARKSESDTQGSELENSLKRVELGAQLLSGVRDEGSYQWAKKRAVAIGLPIENLPETYDPAFVEQTLQSGMKIKDQLVQKLNEQKFGEQQKQSGIDNTFQQGQLDVSRGRLGLAQAGLGERQRHNQVMENRPQAGFSMSYDPEGRPVMSYGPGGMPKLTEQQGKATSYAIRGGEADGQLEAMEAGGYRVGLGTQMKQAAGRATGAPDRFLDATGQKYNQAAGVFINAINRQDSGAAIPEVEWERAGRLYLVQPNDDDATIAQKRQARKTALEATEVVAGPGRAALPPNTPRTPVSMAQPGGETPAPQRATNPSTGEVLELQGGQWQPVR